MKFDYAIECLIDRIDYLKRSADRGCHIDRYKYKAPVLREAIEILKESGEK